ncbi:MAG: hypothetical protein DRQ58_04050 [Gammaproteobacteria bacterium]|nr:MAG: hypothetical protein DRQ58_04050 [Gammaproteobacteria bacterium]
MEKIKKLYLNVLAGTFLILFSGTAFSLETDRTLTVTLHASDQESVDIGQVIFTANNEGYSYQFTLDEENFEKQFLSMRPFDCIQKPKMMVCHLPYPYQNNKFISADDMADLEYELMFLHKYPGAYGIDPWNGIYYKLQLTDKGIEGVLHDVDMKVLTAPPDEGNLRPLTHKMLYQANPAKHWFYTVTIH